MTSHNDTEDFETIVGFDGKQHRILKDGRRMRISLAMRDAALGGYPGVVSLQRLAGVAREILVRRTAGRARCVVAPMVSCIAKQGTVTTPSQTDAPTTR